MHSEPSDMGFFSFDNLEIYKLAVKYGVAVYQISQGFPQRERLGLTNQLRRASTSVASNIAQGQGRGSGVDFARFLFISRGSVLESVNALHFARELGFIPLEEPIRLRKPASQLNGKLNGFLRSLGAEA